MAWYSPELPYFRYFKLHSEIRSSTVPPSSAPVIKAFFDQPTNTISYLVADPATRRAAVIDPVLDYDHRDGDG